MEQPSARIFLRPIGSPLTIGMAGLSIASLVQGGYDLRWVSSGQKDEVGVILLAVPFVLQLIACVFSYLARDGATGAAVGVLAATWGGIGLVHLVSAPGAQSGALGLLLLAAGAMIGFSAIAVGMSKPLPGLIFSLAAVRFLLAGIYELGGTSTWRDAAGITSLVVLGLAAYAVMAFELEGQRDRPLLPTFRRGRGARAIYGDRRAQVDGVASEAGVRQMT